ncbi:DnaD domain protein [Paenibacillus tarimensis]
MNDPQIGFTDGMASALQAGGAFIPAVLLRTYHKLGLSEEELVLLLQLMCYKQAEAIEFPTPEQLAQRLGKTPQEIGRLLQRLLKERFLTIDEQFDDDTGVQSERYNWSGWIRKAAQAIDTRKQAALEGSPFKTGAANNKYSSSNNLYSLFEQEFGRPLSPMELETISGWLDQDRYPEELIRFALKEAVFAGKLHFRYIDRILLEWSRNRVTNSDEARAHTQNFRSGGKG